MRSSGQPEGEAIAAALMTRRAVVTGMAMMSVAGAIALALPRSLTAAAASRPDNSGTVRIEKFSDAGKSLGVEAFPKVMKSDAEWRKQLSPLSYEITRQQGTERAGSNDGEHSDGLYHCICCETVLYDSRTKFESGTGWPSFYQPISKLNVVESNDSSFGMQRIAVSCRRCDAHLGHVFDDGPRPTGLRYCMNGVAM